MEETQKNKLEIAFKQSLTAVRSFICQKSIMIYLEITGSNMSKCKKRVYSSILTCSSLLQ